MIRLYKNLVNLLQQEIALNREFIDLLRKEWKMVAEYSQDPLQEIVKRKETLLLKMEVVEENREKAVRQFAGRLNLSAAEITLKQLIGRCQDPLKRQLTAYREKLLKQIESIRRLNEKNKNLITYSSQALKKSFLFLHHMGRETESSYHADGRLQTGPAHSLILNADV